MFAAAAPFPLGSKAVTWTAVLGVSGNAFDLQSGQITFPAAQNASAGANVLDDYEEGTWTPVLDFVTIGNLSVAYTTQLGTYVKIGRSVKILYNVVTSTFTYTTSSGNFRMTGVPFTAFATQNTENAIGSFQGIVMASFTQFSAQIAAGTTVLTFFGSGTGQNRTQLTITQVATATQKTLIGQLGFFV